jgi:hypothetical protein
VELSQIHPVLDNRNKPIPIPTAFDINTSIQRALVKAIALHGLGLYIYAGEDLPDVPASSKTVSDDTREAMPKDDQKWLGTIADGVRSELETKGAAAALSLLEGQGLDADDKVALWGLLDSKERAALKGARK